MAKTMNAAAASTQTTKGQFGSKSKPTTDVSMPPTREKSGSKRPMPPASLEDLYAAPPQEDGEKS